MSRPQHSRLPYLPGIDALRAIAVMGVFLYHAGVGWIPGGFLGVDVFFVISGYLITSLLVDEFKRTGKVNLKAFWIARARRLLPAVGVFIAFTMVLALIFTPGDVDKLRGDAISSLSYFANWHFIFTNQSYFEQFNRPSLFRHLWSLSVEEQFYLLWPPIFAVAMVRFGRNRVLWGVLAGAIASVGLMALLFHPYGDVSRVYYGTDTRAVGLLIGVALALVWNPIAVRRRRVGRWAPVLLDAAGSVALVLVLFTFIHVHDFDLSLYRGGLLWLALLTATLIMVVAHPRARLGSLLAQPPLIWLGLRSYSFYLYHWPVLALTRPGVDVSMPRWVLVPLQLAVTLGLTELSYRYVETRFRKAGAGRGRAGVILQRRLSLGLAVAVLGTVALVGWSGIAGAGSGAPAGVPESSLASKAIVKADGSEASDPGGPPRIMALGDSVMIGAKTQLSQLLGSRFSMDAQVGRQADDFVALVDQLDVEGHLPDDLIIQMGNNGPLYDQQMEAIRQATKDIPHLFLISDHAPVSWVDESNSKLTEAADTWPNATLIDWAATIADRDDLLWDGLHLRPEGADLYAHLVARTVRNDGTPFPPPPPQTGTSVGATGATGPTSASASTGG